MCFGATYAFAEQQGRPGGIRHAPDGTTGFVDPLPACDSHFEGLRRASNRSSRTRMTHSGLLVTVDVPGLPVTGAPGDPCYPRVAHDRVRAVARRPHTVGLLQRQRWEHTILSLIEDVVSFRQQLGSALARACQDVDRRRDVVSAPRARAVSSDALAPG